MTGHATIADLAAAYREGRTTPSAQTRTVLARIARDDGGRHAFARVLPEHALAAAAAAERELAAGRDRGPLHGVPVGIKDMFDLVGHTWQAGMPWRETAPAAADADDADVVTRLRASGAVLVGTLTMTEGAYFEHHPDVSVPVHPGRSELWSGASSSGPAVAVAAGLVDAAIGSDTGGSIRLPAAATGLTGLKPTRGRVPVRGAFAAAASLDHIGPLVRTAADARTVLAAIGGPAGPQPRRTGQRLRVGVDPALSDEVAPAVRRALADVQAVLAQVADVVEVTLPDTEEVREAWAVLCSTEAAYHHRASFPAQRHRYGSLAGFLDAGRATAGTDVIAARHVRREYTGRLDAVFADLDVVLLPTQPTAAITVAQKDELIADPAALGRFTRFVTPFDMSGHPALALPATPDEAGLPVSVQLVGRHHEDETVLEVAERMQAVTDWHRASG